METGLKLSFLDQTIFSLAINKQLICRHLLVEYFDSYNITYETSRIISGLKEILQKIKKLESSTIIENKVLVEIDADYNDYM